MNTLKTIQTLAKIGKIFSKIIFICCLVGFCGCIVGIVSLAIGAETFKLGGVTFHNMIENEARMTMPTVSNIPAGSYERMVLVLSADGLERSTPVVESLVIDADGASWSNP